MQRSLILLALATLLGAGTSSADDRQLRHAVFFEFKESSSPSDVQGVVDAFDRLPGKMDMIADYASGKTDGAQPNADGLTHGFMVGFETEADRAEYLPHADHEEFVGILKPHLEHVFVFDFWGTPCPVETSHLKHCVFFKFKPDAASVGC